VWYTKFPYTNSEEGAQLLSNSRRPRPRFP
jgi:hypothetical protein